MEIPHIVIGKGSNLLFCDEGVCGIVIKLDRQWSNYEIIDNTIVVQSGLFVPKLAHIAGEYGLSGLEHTIGIPGNLGGLTAMNGGSQQKNISSVTKWVRVIQPSGDIATYKKDECGFEYRHSRFLDENMIIVEVCLKLQINDKRKIHTEMIEILRSRRNKFPRRLPNCGSVFKSTPELYKTIGAPGKIIEELGLKGYRMGDAEISVKHANFIVNKGMAKAKDVLNIITHTINLVKAKIGISLVSEVMLVDHSGVILPINGDIF